MQSVRYTIKAYIITFKVRTDNCRAKIDASYLVLFIKCTGDGPTFRPYKAILIAYRPFKKTFNIL